MGWVHASGGSSIRPPSQQRMARSAVSARQSTPRCPPTRQEAAVLVKRLCRGLRPAPVLTEQLRAPHTQLARPCSGDGKVLAWPSPTAGSRAHHNRLALPPAPSLSLTSCCAPTASCPQPSHGHAAPAPASLPSACVIRTSTPGNGWPTVPGRRSPLRARVGGGSDGGLQGKVRKPQHTPAATLQ